MASSSTETPPKSFEIISEDETDPKKIAIEATDYIFDMAKEDSCKFIEDDPDLTTMSLAQKKFVVKLMSDRIVDKYMLRFKREIYKKMMDEKKAETDLSECVCPEKNEETNEERNDKKE